LDHKEFKGHPEQTAP
jgi:hypothetical protein